MPKKTADELLDELAEKEYANEHEYSASFGDIEFDNWLYDKSCRDCGNYMSNHDRSNYHGGDQVDGNRKCIPCGIETMFEELSRVGASR